MEFISNLIELLINEPILAALVALSGLAGIFISHFGGRSRKEKRHRMYQKSAKSVSKWAIAAERGEIITRLRKIHPTVFEELVLESCALMGAKVYRNWRYTGDGGIDGRIKYKGHFYLIQCKRYTTPIKTKHLRDFEKLCIQRRCRGLFVHTSNSVVSPLSKAVTVVSGDELVNLTKGTELHF